MFLQFAKTVPTKAVIESKTEDEDKFLPTKVSTAFDHVYRDCFSNTFLCISSFFFQKLDTFFYVIECVTETFLNFVLGSSVNTKRESKQSEGQNFAISSFEHNEFFRNYS